MGQRMRLPGDLILATVSSLSMGASRPNMILRPTGLPTREPNVTHTQLLVWAWLRTPPIIISLLTNLPALILVHGLLLPCYL